MQLLTYKDTKIQSLSVYKQFGESKWIPFAKENAKLSRKSAHELKGIGLGKFLLSVAMGASLEDQVESIKKHRDKVDILTCDKGFGPLLEHGIKADYVMICDANIEFKHIASYINETKDVKLLCTPYANIEWTAGWQGDRYFYINKDSIESELKFMEIMGNDLRVIAAGSNVSNAMIIFMMGCDETSKINWGAYESIFLVGYDYSWRINGNYYAWANPNKRFYMAHRTLLDINKDWVFTSENLFFSAKWMTMYCQAYDMPVFNCSGRGLLQIKRMGNLQEYLEKINRSKYILNMVHQAYESLRETRAIYEKAKENFNKAREGLLQWQ